MKGSPDQSDLLLLLFFAIPVVIVVRMFWLAWTEGRDPERDSASVQYEPPDKLSPAECGALVENDVPVHLITATIVDLSVQGYLSIEQKDDIGLPAPQGCQNYVFHMLRDQSAWKSLKPHELAVIVAMFVPANPLRMLADSMARLQSAPHSPLLDDSFARVQEKIAGNPLLHAISEAPETALPSVAWLELQNNFFMHLERIRASVFHDLVAGGYYQRRPDQIGWLYAAKGIVEGFLMAVAGNWVALKTGMAPLPLILAGILTGAFIAVSGKLLSPRTKAGARTYAKIQGFKDYLERVEKAQMEKLDLSPELFEKYLPYAMALRVETKWSQAFSGVTVPAPQWYQREHRGDFFPMHFADDLAGMSNQAGSILTSKPGSSA